MQNQRVALRNKELAAFRLIKNLFPITTVVDDVYSFFWVFFLWNNYIDCAELN